MKPSRLKLINMIFILGIAFSALGVEGRDGVIGNVLPTKSAQISQKPQRSSVKAPNNAAPKDSRGNLDVASGVAPKQIKDDIIDRAIRYFSEADSVHREAWWVLVGVKGPVEKSPFGKVARAFKTSQNQKLSNKSMFRCDRYLISRKNLSRTGYPQSAQIFEQCNLKVAANKIADVTILDSSEIKVIFYPEKLEDLLGKAASTLARPITCNLIGQEKLQAMSCFEWHQWKEKDFSIKLDTYKFSIVNANTMEFSGKVYEHLADVRQIEAKVPKKGKILVKEEEIYPPEEELVVEAKPDPKAEAQAKAAAKALAQKEAQRRKSGPVPESSGVRGGANPDLSTGAIPAAGAVDPDVKMQRQQLPVETEHGQVEGESAGEGVNSQNDGWPTAEDGSPLPVMGDDGLMYYPTEDGGFVPASEATAPEQAPLAHPERKKELDPYGR